MGIPTWFYDRGAIKDQAQTGTSKGLSQAINRGPIRKFLPKYAYVFVTIQSHGLSAGARTHYVTANGVWNGLQFLQRSHASFIHSLPEFLSVCLRPGIYIYPKKHMKAYIIPARLPSGNVFNLGSAERSLQRHSSHLLRALMRRALIKP